METDVFLAKGEIDVMIIIVSQGPKFKLIQKQRADLFDLSPVKIPHNHVACGQNKIKVKLLNTLFSEQIRHVHISSSQCNGYY